MEGKGFLDRSIADPLALICRQDEKGTDAPLRVAVGELASAEVDRADSGAVLDDEIVLSPGHGHPGAQLPDRLDRGRARVAVLLVERQEALDLHAVQQRELLFPDFLKADAVHHFLRARVREPEACFDHSGGLVGREMRVVDLDIVGKGDLSLKAFKAIARFLAEDPRLRDREIAFRRFVRQTVCRPVALKADVPVRDELDIVNRSPGRLKSFGHGSDIIPVGLHVEGPHIREDQARVVGFQKLFKHDLAQSVDHGAVELAEDLEHRLDHHVIVKQPEIAYLHKLLPDRHFPDSPAAEEDDKIHMFFLNALIITGRCGASSARSIGAAGRQCGGFRAAQDHDNTIFVRTVRRSAPGNNCPLTGTGRQPGMRRSRR